MSNIGNAWNGEDNVSAARMNAKTVWIGTGTQLASLSPTYPGQIVVSTTTAGGFISDTVYFRDASDSQWLFLSMSKHTHNSDTNLAGGLYGYILYDNLADVYLLDYGNAKKEYFHSIVGGAGTVINDVTSSAGKVVVNTGTTTGDYAQIVDYGIKFGFARKSRLSIKMGCDTDLQSIVRVGVAGEDVNGANTATSKYGIEGCESTGTNWVMFSANGVTRAGVVTTTTPVDHGYDTTGAHYRLDHTPNVDIKFYSNGVNCGASCTKSTYVPNGQEPYTDTGSDYVLRLGIKTTSAAAKRITLWGLKLVGKIHDSVWF